MGSFLANVVSRMLLCPAALRGADRAKADAFSIARCRKTSPLAGALHANTATRIRFLRETRYASPAAYLCWRADFDLMRRVRQRWRQRWRDRGYDRGQQRGAYNCSQLAGRRQRYGIHWQWHDDSFRYDRFDGWNGCHNTGCANHADEHEYEHRQRHNVPGDTFDNHAVCLRHRRADAPQ
jgi:hypothetical protein